VCFRLEGTVPYNWFISISQIYRTTLHYPPIRRVSSSYISWRVAHFQVLRPTIYLIKGGLICQQNIGTATLRWGGTYKPVYTVSRRVTTPLTRPRSVDSGTSYTRVAARRLLKWHCLKAWTAKTIRPSFELIGWCWVEPCGVQFMVFILSAQLAYMRSSLTIKCVRVSRIGTSGQVR
jgi:hypothetical protein